ncbi:MAG: hypothetical protein JNK48_15040 [Bryobacterales bacterium]|nr:hypothetical protein [Bryobacterales bacterium]
MPKFDMPEITVSGVRRSVLYQPLAALLTILLSPLGSWIAGRGRPGPKPLHANAQVASLCLPSNNSIIRNYCVDGISYATALIPFEQEAVNVYLAMHGLPSNEGSFIYVYGRQDLRNSVRAVMYTMLVNTLIKKPADRTANEQAIHDWMQKLVQKNEIKLYEQALAHYNLFQNDPCRFRVDSHLGEIYKIAWDGTPYCFGATQMSSIFAPPVPDSGYFHAYGMKKSYMAKADPAYEFWSPEYAAIFADTSVSTAEVVGVGLAAGVAAGTAIGVGLAVNFTAALSAYLASGAAAALAQGSTFLISGAAFAAGSGVTIVAAVAGPVLVGVIAVATAVIAGYMLFENEKQVRNIQAFNDKLLAARSAAPDLTAFIGDSTGQGAYKLQSTLYSETVPDAPSTAALPGHRSGDMSFVITPQNSTQKQYSETLRYLDWDNNVRTVRTSGGWLVTTCAKGTNSTKDCTQADSIGASLRYQDWSGRTLVGSRSGIRFTSTKSSLGPADAACPADPVTFSTTAADLSKCISFVSTTLQLKDENGNPITAALSEFGPPIFADPGPLSFGLGVPSTKLITTINNPPANICWSTGLAPGFTIPTTLCASPSFPLTYNGPLTASPVTFNMQLTATNTYGTTTRTFPVSVDNRLAIINTLDCTTFSFGCYLPVTYGQQVNHRVVATGSPTPRLALDTSGSDFTGLTFTDNGDGTGLLSGKALGSPFSGGTCGDLLNPPLRRVRGQQFHTRLRHPAPASGDHLCPAGPAGCAGGPRHLSLRGRRAQLRALVGYRPHHQCHLGHRIEPALADPPG